MTSGHRTAFAVWLLLAAIVPVCLLPPGHAQGQTPPPEPAATPAPAASDAAPPAGEPPTETRSLTYLKGPSGEPVPVPADATVREFLEWKQRQQQAGPRPVPESGVTSLSLTGTAEDDRVTLQAVIKIQVNRADDWVRVPLQLTEAILQQTGHEGPGEASFAGFDREAGYRWWLQGKGEHQLTLSLIVPIRKQTPGRRLQLSLPSTAVSQMTLGVPMPRISTKVLPEAAWARTTPAEAGSSQIEIRGLGTRLDVSWQPLPSLENIDAALRAETWISVDLTGESIVLEAEQTVEAQGGSFSQFTVKLPAGFSLLDVEERQGKHYGSHQVDSDDPTRVTVRLTEPTVEPVRLKWTLGSEFSADGQEFTLQGFEVVGAQRQTGEVAVFSAEGYRVTRRKADERLLSRTNAAPRIPRNGRLVGAWRFLQQPFRLALDVAEIEPYFSVAAKYNLKFTGDQAELTGNLTFDVDPDRGALQEFVLRWPNWKSENWTLDPFESRGLVEQVVYGEGDAADEIRVRLAGRKTGTFELPLRARRAVPAGSEAFPLTLPTVPSSARPDTALQVQADANLEVGLSAAGGTILQSVAERSQEDEGASALRNLEYRIDSESHSLSARVVAHTQAVQTQSIVTLEAGQDRLLVAQRINYQVAWEPLSHVRIMMPAELERRVVFQIGNSTLTPSFTGLEVGTLKQIRLSLPKPELGSVDIIARFAPELPELADEQSKIAFVVPLLQPSDADPASVRVVARTPDNTELVLGGSAWELQPTLDGTREWLARSPQSELELLLIRAGASTADSYSISKALVRTALDADGTARSRASYRLDRPVSRIVLLVPADIAVSEIWWNRLKLTAEQVREISTGRLELTIPPSEAAEAPLLTVDFHIREGTPFELARAHRLAAPQFPPNVWVEQTIWELALPYNQHLFTSPRGFISQFRWQRGTLLWSRIPLPELNRTADWIDTEDGPAERIEFAAGNVYPFGRFGPTGSIAFTSMSRSMIVLLGAGSALIAAFILMKIPASRSVLTLLAAAFATAVVSLWYSEAVQLLLQPAILGIALAVLATTIERIFHREPAPAILTLSSPSDYSGPTRPSSVDQFFGPALGGPPFDGHAIGSEDPTAIRSLPRGSEPVSSSGSRSGQ